MKKRILSLLLSAALAVGMVSSLGVASASAAEVDTTTEYEIYPVVQQIEYQDTSTELPKSVNLVYSESIDDATKKKIKAVLDAKGITYTVSSEPADNAFNVVVAVDGEGFATAEYSIGDIDHNGDIDAADAILVLQRYAGIIQDDTAGYDAALADVNGDNAVDAEDAILILQLYAEIIAAFPNNTPVEYAASNYELPQAASADFFDNIDSYILSVDDDSIDIVGKDTDAAFYGVVTLKMIFEQIDNSIRALRVDDYSDALTRGFIEGYYGIPWSNEDRMSLMEFGGDLKMTSYIFAPKDDPYHNKQWTTMYPEEELAKVAEMVQTGVDSKCRFVWSIHPFMSNAITSANYNERIETIKQKFEQLYSVGVRQFAVLADDASSETTVQRQVCIDLDAWCKAKGDCYDLLFCPQSYNYSWTSVDANGKSPYFTTLMNGMPETVHVMWTGNSVCGWITQDTFNKFTTLTGTEALMWLNWPVNDINNRRMLMGKGEVMGEGVTGFSGIVTNPMQQAEPSKVALFAVADYTWNRSGWDADQSWADCFKYIDPAIADDLYLFAQNNSDPSPNTHGLVLQESEYIAADLAAFTTAFDSGASVKEIGETLITKYQEMIDACNNIEANGTVENLVTQIKPWIDSLRYLATASLNFIKTAIAIEDGDENNIIWAYYSQASAAYTASQNCPVVNLDNIGYVQAGAKRLIPFAAHLAEVLAPQVDAVVNPNGSSAGSTLTPTGIIKSADMNSVYDGSEANITDGNNSTYCWYQTAGNTVTAGGYIGIEFAQAEKIGTVTIKQGTGSSTSDIFSNAVLEYSLDGVTYTEIGAVTTADATFRLPTAVNAKYLRLRTLANTGKWYAICEFSATAGSDELDISTVAYTNVATLAAIPVTSTDDTATLGAVSGEITLKPNQYVGVALTRIKKIVDAATIEGSNLANLTVEYSMNGIEWTTDVSNARYVRLINKTDADITTTVTSFVVKSDEVAPISVAENTLGEPTSDTTMVALNAFDGDRATRAWFCEGQAAGKYVIYDLGQDLVIDSLNFVMYDGEIDFIRNGKVSISPDNATWTDVITLGNGSTDVEIGDIYTHDVSYYVVGNDDVGGITARYIKVELTSGPGAAAKWTRFNEIEINDGAYRPTTTDPTFTQDVEVETNKTPFKLIDGNLSTTYLPMTANSSVVYNVSEKTNITSITLLQSPATISNANVEVRTGADTWTSIGTLSESLNKFENLSFENVLAIRISWTDVIPEFHEMYLTYAESEGSNVDKAALMAKYNEAEGLNSANYTPNSYATLLNAMTAASGVINFKNATQDDVDAALLALENAIANLEKQIADKAQLTGLVNQAKALNQASYSADTWSALQTAITSAEATLAKDPLYQGESNEAVALLQSAMDSLVMVGTQQVVAASTLTATAASYQQGNGAELAVDGVNDTMWHSAWSSASGVMPTFGENGENNYITITLDQNRYINKIEYLPRASQTNGNIIDYKILYSENETGDDFKEFIGGTGTWANNQNLKTAEFIQANARRIRIVALSTEGDGTQQNLFIAAREFTLYEIIPTV